MNPFDAYRTYLAMKRHFTSNYDYVKYNGKVNVSVAAFEKRKDKYFFEKLGKFKDPHGLLISALFNDPNVWIGDILTEESIKRYNAMKGRWETASYRFKQDLNQFDDLNTAMKVVDGEAPEIFGAYLDGRVSPETLIILNTIGKVFNYWKSNVSDAYVFPGELMSLEKMGSFFKPDRTKYLESFRRIMAEREE